MTTEEIIACIADALRGCSGSVIAETYNSICADRIRYDGDEMFSTDDTPEEEPFLLVPPPS